MKKLYKNRDYIIYGNLAQNQKAKLIVELNKKLKNWLNACVQETLNKGGFGFEEVEINVYKGTPFFKYSTIEKSNGSMNVEVNVYYNNGDHEKFFKDIYGNGRTFI